MAQFSVNETALAKDGPLLYDAKIRKIADSESTSTKYFIHYQGWKQKFDTWVTADCLLKYTESNLQLKKELKSELEDNKNEKRLSRKRRTKSLPNTSLTKCLKRSTKSMSNVTLQNCMRLSINMQLNNKLKMPETKIPKKCVIIPLKKIDVDPLAVGNNFNVENHNTMSENVSTSELGNSNIDTTTGDEKQSDSVDIPTTGDLSMDTKANYDTLNGICTQASDLTENPLEFETQYEWCQTEKHNIIPLPDELRTIIKNDYDILKGKQKGLMLPANPSVAELLQNYVEHKRTLMPEEDISDIEEFVRGVKEYFNVLVDQQLLYKFEKKRHAEIRKAYKNTQMSDIYGAMHLIRMVAEIGPYIIESIRDDNAIQLMIFHFCEMLKYIKENSTLLNEDMYIVLSK